ncbi:MAG: TctC [Deltaproteobacteria bacterium]|nr:TctC [Deltaproteobacteria bacterium]
MKPTKIVLVVIAFMAVAVLATLPCWAADAKYPAKPIHMWVGFAAGGPTDSIARAISNIAEKILGQPIIVENKPGGGGALLLGLMMSAPSDGYTIATTTDTPYTRTPHLVNVKYNAMEDFAPIVRFGLQRQGIVVKADSPFKKWQDVIDYARKNPGQFTYGTPGPGTTPHLAIEKIALHDKVKFQHVPFQGDAPAMTALLGGHVMAASSGVLAWIQHVKAGSFRLLLVFDPEGVDQFPDVPTFKQLGYNFDAPTAQMLSAPKRVPKPIMDRLVAVFSEAMMTPQFQKFAKDQELLSVKPLAGADFQKWLQSQYTMYGTFINEVGLRKKTD